MTGLGGIALPRRHLARPGGGGGGSGAAASAFQRYTFGAITAQGDPSNLVGTVAQAADGSQWLSLPVASGVSATTVGAMAWVEWDLVDWTGSALDACTAADLVRVLVQWLDGVLPIGLRLGVAMTDLGMGGTPQQGFAAGVQMHAANNSLYAWSSMLAAGSWSAINTATQPWQLTRAVEGAPIQGESSTRLHVSATPWDAVGEYGPTAVISTETVTTSAANANGTYTKIALLIGTSAALGGAATVRAGIASILERLADVSGRAARASAPTVTPRFPSDGDYCILVAGGHSYGNGYNTTSALGGAATSTGLAHTWTIRDAGATITTWPNTISANVGFPAYLVGLCDDWSGNTGGALVRRCTNGAEIADRTNRECDGDLGGALTADLAALGRTRVDLAVIPIGTNDAKSSPLTAAFRQWLERQIRLLRDHSPNAIIYLFEDLSTATNIAAVEADKAGIAADPEFEHVYYLPDLYTGEVLDADGHPSDAGHQSIAAAIDAHLQGLTA